MRRSLGVGLLAAMCVVPSEGVAMSKHHRKPVYEDHAETQAQMQKHIEHAKIAAVEGPLAFKVHHREQDEDSDWETMPSFEQEKHVSLKLDDPPVNHAHHKKRPINVDKDLDGVTFVEDGVNVDDVDLDAMEGNDDYSFVQAEADDAGKEIEGLEESQLEMHGLVPSQDEKRYAKNSDLEEDEENELDEEDEEEEGEEERFMQRKGRGKSPREKRFHAMHENQWTDNQEDEFGNDEDEEDEEDDDDDEDDEEEEPSFRAKKRKSPRRRRRQEEDDEEEEDEEEQEPSKARFAQHSRAAAASTACADEKAVAKESFTKFRDHMQKRSEKAKAVLSSFAPVVGLEVMAVTENMGPVVSEVPSEVSGLLIGDELISVNGDKVTNVEEVQKVLVPGRKFAMQVKRDSQTTTTMVEVGSNEYSKEQLARFKRLSKFDMADFVADLDEHADDMPAVFLESAPGLDVASLFADVAPAPRKPSVMDHSSTFADLHDTDLDDFDDLQTLGLKMSQVKVTTVGTARAAEERRERDEREAKEHQQNSGVRGFTQDELDNLLKKASSSSSSSSSVTSAKLSRF